MEAKDEETGMSTGPIFPGRRYSVRSRSSSDVLLFVFPRRVVCIVILEYFAASSFFFSFFLLTYSLL